MIEGELEDTRSLKAKKEYTIKECVVVGAGISGIATARWLKEYKYNFVILERSSDIGGLWRFREADYGVMSFTHINVSKHNYCFSDHSFPEDSIDYPHHAKMFDYIKSYFDKHRLSEHVSFDSEVVSIEELNPNENEYFGSRNEWPKFENLKSYSRLWKVKVSKNDKQVVYITPYVAIASGHHATPVYAEFPGQKTFKGEIIHSVKYKNAEFNRMQNKRVLVVGIGNSAVDVATNLYEEGRCPNVCISTRSGAWLIPNYISGFPIDLYANRVFLKLPWKIATFIYEQNIKMVYGDPRNVNLNPKMRALQSQPTLSPTLMNHLQRKHIHIKPNVKAISGNEITFEDNTRDEFDAIVLCTGYRIALDFLSPEVRKNIFESPEQNSINLYKQVFHPRYRESLGFIGFAQPTSGGLLPISEIQGRWFVYLMSGKAQLPSTDEMRTTTEKEKSAMQKRFHKSNRHTLQLDPITYNDEIAATFGAKPSLLNNGLIAWRLLFSSCGPAQWRLNGPDSSHQASNLVKGVPVTDLMKLMAILLLVLLLIVMAKLLQNPVVLVLLVAGIAAYIQVIRPRWRERQNGARN